MDDDESNSLDNILNPQGDNNELPTYEEVMKDLYKSKSYSLTPPNKMIISNVNKYTELPNEDEGSIRSLTEEYQNLLNRSLIKPNTINIVNKEHINNRQKNTINCVIEYFNKELNNLYYLSQTALRQPYLEIEQENNIARYFSNDGDVKYTNLIFYIVDNNNEINNEIIKHFPNKTNSYIYVDYNNYVLDNIYIVLLSDSNFKNNANYLFSKLPSIIINMLERFNSVKLISNSLINLTVSYEYNEDDCLLTDTLIESIYKTIFNSNVCYIKYCKDSATQLNIINDEDPNILEEIKELPDEHDVYNNNNKLIVVYIKLTRLRNSLDRIISKLYEMYVKDRLINNRVAINNSNEETRTLFNNMLSQHQPPRQM